jgi:hypothetical protein
MRVSGARFEQPEAAYPLESLSQAGTQHSQKTSRFEFSWAPIPDNRSSSHFRAVDKHQWIVNALLGFQSVWPGPGVTANQMTHHRCGSVVIVEPLTIEEQKQYQ